MNAHSIHVIGNATSVTSRFGSENGFVRPQQLVDVTCINTSGGNLYMQVFDITNTLVPFGSVYTNLLPFTLTGLTVGHTYSYNFGANEASISDTPSSYTTKAGTFVALNTSIQIFPSVSGGFVTLQLNDLTVPQATPVPIEGAVPKFSFPVLAGLGGTLGRECYMSGIYCCWSSTQATKTIAAASGEINILLRD